MRYAIILCSVVLVSSGIVFFGCDSQKRDISVVQGQVFVTLKTGGSVELGDIPVYAIPSRRFDSHVDSIKETRARYVDSTAGKIAAFANNVDEKVEKEDFQIDHSEREQALLDSLESRIENYLQVSTLSPFLSSLPPGVDTARTDASGRYQLSVPASKKYYITAGASRTLGSGIDATVERYFWAKKLSVGRDTTNQDLSNSDLAFYSRGATTQGQLRKDNVVIYSEQGTRDMARSLVSLISGEVTIFGTVDKKDRSWAELMRLSALDPDSLYSEATGQ